MNNTILAVVVVGIVAVGAFYAFNAYIYNEKQAEGETPVPTVEQPARVSYENDVAGFRFVYPSGADGYVEMETGSELSDSPLFVSGIILAQKAEVEALRESDEPREGPPTMSVFVFKNEAGLTPQEWAEANSLHTNINLALGEVEETAVAGKEAVSFMSDGLYAATVYAVAHNEFILVARGEYLDRDSSLYRDFQGLINSLEFTD